MAASMSSTTTTMSMTGLAARPGTLVDPTCSTPRGVRQRRLDARPLDVEPPRPVRVVLDQHDGPRLAPTDEPLGIDLACHAATVPARPPPIYAVVGSEGAGMSTVTVFVDDPVQGHLPTAGATDGSAGRGVAPDPADGSAARRAGSGS